tara:strand:+ start:99 stop:563 length:465 start_codon:yes stop_codon:yes gene_type:complete
MQKLKPQKTMGIKFLLVLLFLLSCGTTNPFMQSYEELDTKIKLFNLEFESKALNRCSRFIHPDFLKEFQRKSLDFQKNVTILSTTTLGMKIFKDEKPVITNSSIFKIDFNKAEILIRYQLSILPSTKIKTLIVKQEWVKLNDIWFAIPNLDSFI